MRSRQRGQLDVSVLVDTMFGDVFTADERGDLLAWIHAWEAENPGVTAAERVTGWIDVAYAFQERGVSQPSWRPPKAAARTTQRVTAIRERMGSDPLAGVSVT